MDIHLLGTGGADGVPALFSDTRVSKYARDHGGKDVRSRAAALVDGCLKLDLGPDTWSQVTRERLNPLDWTAVMFTHSDADHFAVDELQYSLYPFNKLDRAGFTIYGNEHVVKKIADKYPDWPFEVIQTKMFCAFQHGEYTITPIMARHMQFEEAHNFLIQDGEKTLLYGTDTGVWAEPTWAFLMDYKIDCLVLECSEGFAFTTYNGHLDIDEFKLVIGRLRRQGTIDDHTKVVTTHHSHNGNATHEELEKALGPAGVEIGFDGLKIEF